MSIVPGALCLNLCVQELMTALEVSEAAVSSQKNLPKEQKSNIKKNRKEHHGFILSFDVWCNGKKKKIKKLFNQLNFSLITQTPCSQKMRGIKCFPMPQVLAQNHNHVLPAVQGPEPQVCVTNSCSFPAQTFPALFLLFSCPDFSSWAHSLEAKAV